MRLASLLTCFSVLFHLAQTAQAQDHRVVRFFDWDNTIAESLSDIRITSGSGIFLGFLSDTLTIFPAETLEFAFTKEGLKGKYIVHPYQFFKTEVSLEQLNKPIDRIEEQYCIDNKIQKLDQLPLDQCSKRITIGKISKTVVTPELRPAIAQFKNVGRVEKYAFIFPKFDTTIQVENQVSLDNAFPRPNIPTISSRNTESSGGIVSRSAFDMAPMRVEGNFLPTDVFYLNGIEFGSAASPFLINRDELETEHDNHILVRRSLDAANCRVNFPGDQVALILNCGWEGW